MSKFSDFISDDIITESINDKGIFKAVFMSGHSGAGKSYVLSKVKSGSIEPRIVNVDKYLEFLGGGYEDVLYDKSKILTVNQLSLYIDSVLPLAVDVTASTPNSTIRRKALLEAFGYDTAMVFVKCSLETAVERVRQRKGHAPVPTEAIINYYNRVQEIKLYLKSKFSPFIEVENDIGELTDGVVIKVFNRLEGFYLSAVKNHLGQEAIDMMRQNGWKYLSDGIYTMNEIKSMTSKWYYG